MLYRSCYKISVLNLPPTPHALPLSWSTHFIRQQFKNKTVFFKNGDENRTFRGFRGTNFLLDFSASDPFKTGKWNLGNLWNTPVKTVMLRNNESQEEKISWSERMFLFFFLFPSSPRAFYFFRFLLFLEGYPEGASAEGRAFQPHLSSEEKRKVSQGLFTSSTKPSLYTDVVFFFFSFFSSARKKK